jgi:hypothetical protein
MMVIYRGHWRPIAISQILALLYVTFMIFIPMQVMIIVNDAQNIDVAIQNGGCITTSTWPGTRARSPKYRMTLLQRTNEGGKPVG